MGIAKILKKQQSLYTSVRSKSRDQCETIVSFHDVNQNVDLLGSKQFNQDNDALEF